MAAGIAIETPLQDDVRTMVAALNATISLGQVMISGILRPSARAAAIASINAG